MPRRRVLLIGVKNFRPTDLTAVPALDSSSYPTLTFAHDRVDRLKAVLDGYAVGHYEVETLLDPTEDQVNQALREILKDTTAVARVVHVISHGDHDRNQRKRLDMVPACLTTGTPATNVREWISSAQHERQTSPTLFLVDLCGAGRVANPDDIGDLTDDEVKAWAITASKADESAFHGRFSEVVAEVLAECSRNGLGTDSSLEFVRFDLLTTRVSDLMVRRYGPVQQIRWTKAENHQRLTLPFFPNPNYRHSELTMQIAALAPQLRPFLDDKVADARHFQTRAGRHFTGRHSQLRQLVPWLDGAPGGNLRVVTGKPGAGKSALLGALVCAAHPDLIGVVPYVREAVSPCPAPNPSLAAVHARQQSLHDLVMSLTSQLGIIPPTNIAWNAAELCRAVAQLAHRPTVVVDALDECPQFAIVQTVLLMPLANTRRADGTPACRVLVGARPRWQDFAPLFESAESQEGLIDLDRIGQAELRSDLRAYVSALIGEEPFRDVLSEGIAQALTSKPSDWGEFLVAGRFVSYLKRNYPQTAAAADDLIEHVPTELPDVFEREMADHDDPTELRAVLTAVAFAKGLGMPESLAREIALAFGGARPDVLSGDDARVYLRLNIDRDGTSLYRLYHEGLADYLRELHPDGHQRFFYAAIRTRDVAVGPPSWESAPLYLKRHTIEHAADAAAIDRLLDDAEFLVHSDPHALMVQLAKSSIAKGRQVEAVCRASFHLFTDDPEWRRKALRLNALRYGAWDLATRLRRR